MIEFCHFTCDWHIASEGCSPASAFQVKRKGPTMQTIITDEYLISTTVPHCLSVDCLKAGK